jgi:hypothetical protein
MSPLNSNTSEIIASVFTPAERLVVDDWLQHPVEAPPPDSPVMGALAALGFAETTMYEYGLTSAAVAQIALAAVEDRLPQWALVRDDDITLGRLVRPTTERYQRAVHLRPRFLFSLDWASSAPGMSWPRDYYATWFPGYGIWVVTASSDTPHPWGALDVSVGWFSDTQHFHEGVRDVIVAHWQRDEMQEPEFAWETFWKAGLVSETDARTWRDEVWPAPAVDDDEATQNLPTVEQPPLGTTRRGGATYRGLLPATDPFYQSGSLVITGSQLHLPTNMAAKGPKTPSTPAN